MSRITTLVNQIRKAALSPEDITMDVLPYKVPKSNKWTFRSLIFNNDPVTHAFYAINSQYFRPQVISDLISIGFTWNAAKKRIETDDLKAMMNLSKDNNPNKEEE